MKVISAIIPDSGKIKWAVSEFEFENRNYFCFSIFLGDFCLFLLQRVIQNTKKVKVQQKLKLE